jgi:hypothetical protein
MEIAMKTQKKANEHASRVPFTSMCPACGQMRPQDGYDRGSLLRLLRGGYPVEAYCAWCDEYWSIDVPERATLIAATIAEGGVFIC